MAVEVASFLITYRRCIDPAWLGGKGLETGEPAVLENTFKDTSVIIQPIQSTYDIEVDLEGQADNISARKFSGAEDKGRKIELGQPITVGLNETLVIYQPLGTGEGYERSLEINVVKDLRKATE